MENEWTEGEHPIFGEHGVEPAIRTKELVPSLDINDFPLKQWRKGEFSIIPPCGITFGKYELYPVDGDIARFDTLEEAQHCADNLPSL